MVLMKPHSCHTLWKSIGSHSLVLVFGRRLYQIRWAGAWCSTSNGPSLAGASPMRKLVDLKLWSHMFSYAHPVAPVFVLVFLVFLHILECALCLYLLPFRVNTQITDLLKSRKARRPGCFKHSSSILSHRHAAMSTWHAINNIHKRGYVSFELLDAW